MADNKAVENKDTANKNEPVDCSLLFKILSHYSAASYSITNSIIYLKAILDSIDAAKLPEVFGDSLKGASYTSTISQILSTWKSYFHTVMHMFGKVESMPADKQNQSCAESTWNNAMKYVNGPLSSAAKTAGTLYSFYAWFYRTANNFTDDQTAESLAILCVILLGPGVLGAQGSFMGQNPTESSNKQTASAPTSINTAGSEEDDPLLTTNMDFNKKIDCDLVFKFLKQVWAHYCAGSYAICNSILYLNALLASIEAAKLNETATSWLNGISYGATVSQILSTWKSYFYTVMKMVDKSNQTQQSPPQPEGHFKSFWNKSMKYFHGPVTAVSKTASTLYSFFDWTNKTVKIFTSEETAYLTAAILAGILGPGAAMAQGSFMGLNVTDSNKKPGYQPVPTETNAAHDVVININTHNGEESEQFEVSVNSNYGMGAR